MKSWSFGDTRLSTRPLQTSFGLTPRPNCPRKCCRQVRPVLDKTQSQQRTRRRHTLHLARSPMISACCRQAQNYHWAPPVFGHTQVHKDLAVRAKTGPALPKSCLQSLDTPKYTSTQVHKELGVRAKTGPALPTGTSSLWTYPSTQGIRSAY